MVEILIGASKRRRMKIGAKTFEENFRLEATADEVNVPTKPSFRKLVCPNGKLNWWCKGKKEKDNLRFPGVAPW